MIKAAEGLKKRPGLMLLGDFNTDSFDYVEHKKHKRSSSGGDEVVEESDNVVPAQAVPHVVAWNNGELVSVYPLSQAEGEGFTTWKKRGLLEVCPHLSLSYGTCL